MEYTKMIMDLNAYSQHNKIITGHLPDITYWQANRIQILVHSSTSRVRSLNGEITSQFRPQEFSDTFI